MTTNNKLLINKLELAGLNEKEARVYLASLELGSSTMWQIHRKCGIKRPTCYLVFEGLIERGIGIKTNDKKGTLYSVIDPDNLSETLEYKKDQFNQSLSLFDAIKSKSAIKPEITLYSGFEGMRQAYFLGLDQPVGSELRVYGDSKIWSEYESENEEYIQKRVKRKIKIKVLFSDKNAHRKRFKSSKKELRDVRFLPDKSFNPQTEQQLINDYVVFVAYSESEPFATVIKSKTIARLEKEKFDLLWERARPLR